MPIVLYQDDGHNISTEIRTSKIDFGTETKKYIEEINLVADTVSTGTAYLYWSDDDYVTWTSAGTFELSSDKQYLTALGSSARQRAWKFTHATNTAFRVSRFMGEVKVGTT